MLMEGGGDPREGFKKLKNFVYIFKEQFLTRGNREHNES